VLAAALDVGSGWRETYAVTAVLGLLLLVPTLRRLDESASAVPRPLDLPGLVLLVAAVTLAVSALTQGRNGLSASTLVLGVLAMAALAAFVLVERRVPAPLLEPQLLAHPRFRAATGGSLVLGIGMIGLSSFTPVLVQLGYGRSLWVACLPVLAWAGTSVAASLLVRRIPHPLEGPRPVALFLLLVAAGQLLAGWLPAGDSGLVRLVVAMVVAGLGTGVLNAVLGREAIAAVPPDHAAMGSGANNTARYLGAAIGITLTVTIATHAGAGLVAGWNVAVPVAAAVTVVGAGLIGLSPRRP
jgi:predicted MFS family arabinose efflux permease